jgi:hypothetical protein
MKVIADRILKTQESFIFKTLCLDQVSRIVRKSSQIGFLKPNTLLFTKRCVKIKYLKSPDGFQDCMKVIADRILKTQESFIFKTVCLHQVSRIVRKSSQIGFLKPNTLLFTKRCVKIKYLKSPDGFQDCMKVIADRILKTQESFIFKTVCLHQVSRIVRKSSQIGFLKPNTLLFTKRCVKIKYLKSPDGFQDCMKVIADRILKTQESFIFKTVCLHQVSEKS